MRAHAGKREGSVVVATANDTHIPSLQVTGDFTNQSKRVAFKGKVRLVWTP